MRVLLTGGRAPATLELARLCARADHEVHVADTDRWHICRGSRLVAGIHRLPSPRLAGHATYAAAINRVIASRRIDVILPTCEEIFHVAAIRTQLDARVICESLPVLAGLHDKAAFLLLASAAGVRTPRTHALHAAGGADVRELPAGRYVIKRRFSRFATAVRFWRPGDAPPLPAGDDPAAWIAQEQLDGRTLCSWSVAHRGRVLGHVTYAVDATAGPHSAAISFHSERHEAVRAWVTRFLAHHQLTGQFAFDFIEGDGEVSAIECNPRLTSGIHCFREMPAVAGALLHSIADTDTPMLEPPGGLRFRSRLALLTYGHWRAAGSSLLAAADDPWPRRLQALSWVHLLARAALARTDPRVMSTADIEWNGA
jgi:hypothetical protein